MDLSRSLFLSGFLSISPRETLSFERCWLHNVLCAAAVCNFRGMLLPQTSAPDASPTILFDHPGAQSHGKPQHAESFLFVTHVHVSLDMFSLFDISSSGQLSKS